MTDILGLNCPLQPPLATCSVKVTEEDLSSGLGTHTVARACHPRAEETGPGVAWSLTVAGQNLASSSGETGVDHGVRGVETGSCKITSLTESRKQRGETGAGSEFKLSKATPRNELL